MKIKHLKVNAATISTTWPMQTLKVPLVTNFALTASELIVNGVTHLEGEDFALNWEGGEVSWNAELLFKIVDTDSIALKIYYSEILNYADLFSWIGDGALRLIAGNFYREMEGNLEAQAWVSACASAGALLETILSDLVPGNPGSFECLINSAESKGILSPAEAKIAHYLRKLRNTVHPDVIRKGGLPVREDSIKARVLLDRLTQSKWPS